MRKLWAAVSAAIGIAGAALGADIHYAAEGGGGEYCGAGYGVDVSVPADYGEVRITYSQSDEGSWFDALLYTNVCSETPIYFKIEAEGFDSVVDSRKVTITPKTLTSDYVWIVLPTEDYVYDGTAKTPDVAYADGDPSIIARSDFDVTFEKNVNAGTATAKFTGKGNYTGEVTEEFEIQKADNEWTTAPSISNWTYGQAPSDPASAAKSGTAEVTYGTAESPGSLGRTRPALPGDYVATFTVPESQNYKELTADVPFKILPATIRFVADDVSGEYNGSGYGISGTISVSAPLSGATVKYAESETGPWLDAVAYKDVCTEKPIYFAIEAEGYASVTNSRKVTITPKTLTSDYVWIVLPTEDYVYDGTAKTPDVAYADGDPSIIARSDFDVTFEKNVNAGTAAAKFTGKGNYAGEVTESFDILKARVEVPSVSSKVYDGTLQIADISDSALYQVVRNRGGKMAGTYAVVLGIVDSENYRWDDTGADLTVVPFEITKAANEWTSGPIAPASVAGGSAGFPVATAKYGDVEVRYSGTDVDGGVIADALQIVKAGTYTAHFRVRETSSWAGLSANISLKVAENGVVSAGVAQLMSASATVPVNRSLSIPRSWFLQYKGFSEKFGTDLSKAATMDTGKIDGNGNAMKVWQDYVAGTDPTDEDSKLSVAIEIKDGKPNVTWSPNKNAEGVKSGERVYTIWGKKDLSDKEWTPDVDESSGEWKFFKVTVDMP